MKSRASAKRLATPFAVLASIVVFAPALEAANPLPLSAQILGEVRDSQGELKMGASILLYDSHEQLVGKALTDIAGKFVFADVPSGVYAVHVSLASFVPAMRRNIRILAGTENLLRINLATLFSSIQLVPPSTTRGILMSEEWRWVLRSSQATRPVLRLRPQVSSSKSTARPSTFTDPSGVVQFSAGQSGQVNSGLQQNVGTAFSVEASLANDATVRFSGNVGYGAATSLPSSAFRTTYSQDRNGFPGAQTSLTVRQIYFPTQAIPGNAGGATPVLRMITLSGIDQVQIVDELKLEYGFRMDSIALSGRMNYVSPFARASYDLDNIGGKGTVIVAFSSGARPTELFLRTPQTMGEVPEPGMQQDLIALSQGPQISRRDGRATMERRKNYEAAYELRDGSRTYTVSAYHEQVSNAVFLMSGNYDAIRSQNLLADMNSRGTVFNLGSYDRSGYSASATQEFGNVAEFTVAGGRGGALVLDGATPHRLDSGDQIRSRIGTSARNWVTMRASGALPLTGTRLSASYGWTDFRALTPVHMSLTGATNQQVGWTMGFRQPMPSFGGARMELNAELQNALAQGYLRITGADGRTVLLTNSPRAVRGSLRIIF